LSAKGGNVRKDLPSNYLRGKTKQRKRTLPPSEKTEMHPPTEQRRCRFYGTICQV